MPKLKDEFQKTWSFKKLYMYIYVFALIYIEFGYAMVVADKISGSARTLALILFTVPLLFFSEHITVQKAKIFLSLYLYIVVVLNIMRDNTYENYILLLVPIFIGFTVTTSIDMKTIRF